MCMSMVLQVGARDACSEDPQKDRFRRRLIFDVGAAPIQRFQHKKNDRSASSAVLVNLVNTRRTSAGTKYSTLLKRNRHVSGVHLAGFHFVLSRQVLRILLWTRSNIVASTFPFALPKVLFILPNPSSRRALEFGFSACYSIICHGAFSARDCIANMQCFSRAAAKVTYDVAMNITWISCDRIICCEHIGAHGYESRTI